LLLGIGESAFPQRFEIASQRRTGPEPGTANGLVAFAYLFGPSVGAYCGGLIMAEFGWRAAFWVFGGLSLLWLLPCAGRDPANRGSHERRQRPPLHTLLRQPSLWGNEPSGLFSSNYTFYFMLTWLPFYLVRERVFSTGEMAEPGGRAYVVNALSAQSRLAIDRVARSGLRTWLTSQ